MALYISPTNTIPVAGQATLHGMTKNGFPRLQLSVLAAVQQYAISTPHFLETQLLYPKNGPGEISKVCGYGRLWW